LVAFVLVFGAGFGTPQARGEDWPRWRGPRGDGVSRETGLLKEWPAEGPKRLWKAALSGGFSSVAVAGGRVFTQTKEKKQEVVVCFDAASGKELWRHRYDCDYADHPTLTGGYPRGKWLSGPRATPAVDGDRVYTIGVTGVLLCLEAKTGKQVWRRDLLALGKRECHPQGYISSPLVAGDRVYVHPGGPNGRSIAALDKKDGSVAWQALDDPQGHGSPIEIRFGGAAQIVYFTGAGAVGVEPKTGKPLWRYLWKTRFDLNIATPLYSDGRVLVSSGYGTGAAVFRLTRKGEPETVWKKKVLENHFATSVLYKGRVYGFSEYRFRCVDFETGRFLWGTPGLGKGSLLIAGGRLILLTDHGKLILARTDADKYTPISRHQVFDKDTLTWTAPVLSGGVLFVRCENALVAIDVRSKGK
jgi:outer membrane protein assembly factor BamB